MNSTKSFLVVYDYGTGGVWAIITAPSSQHIAEKYPVLNVIEERPASMTDEEMKRIASNSTFDINGMPPDWLIMAMTENDQRTQTMHDWTLNSVAFDWKTARVTLGLGNQQGKTSLNAEGVTDLHVPQRKEWGPSVSVNTLYGPFAIGDGLQKLLISMQSGDVISIVAKSFELPN